MSLIEFKNRILPIKDKLYRFAYRIVGNEAEAQDVVQEVFIKVWDKRSEWHIYQNIEGWCMRATRNLAIDKLRSKHKRTENLDAAYSLSNNEQSPYQHTEKRDTVQKIKTLMLRLPEKQRMVMQLRDIEQMSYQEVADSLEITISQVKVNLFRARKFIRESLINTESYGL